MTYRKYNINNIELHLINTTKFKTNQISINFIDQIKEEDIEFRALLPNILKSRTSELTKLEINKKLQELFGSILYCGVSKIGLISDIDFSLKSINGKLLDINILEDSFKLLSNIIYNPYIKDEGFDNEIVELEKRLLIEEIENLKNNKVTYSINKLYSYMFKGEIASLNINGKIENIKKITNKDLYKYYKENFLNNKIIISVCGNLNYFDIKKLIIKYFKNLNNTSNYQILDLEEKKIKEFTKIEEKDEITQAKLNIGYRTHIRRNDDLYYPMYLANAILGSYMHSKLFTQVREKEGLAYYISSFYDPFKGILVIYAGIEYKNLNKTLEIINKQIDDIKNGNITKNELEITKKQIINDLLELEDSQSSILNRTIGISLLNNKFSLRDRINNINKVTIDDIRNAFSKIEEDTIFVLRGNEDEI